MRMNLSQWTLAVVVVILLAWHERHGPWPPWRIAGALICALSFALVSIARYQLGRSFSVTAQARRLVTTGLYARIRNPIYVFAELFIVGLAMFVERWWLLLFMLAVLPLQVFRARREAAVLEAAFGEEYRRYRARTWF